MTVRDRVRVHIRWMIRCDVPEVLAIEAGGFDRTWDLDQFLQRVRQRNCIAMVAERGDRVVGFMVYELHPRHLQVMNMAVAIDCRRAGVGVQMVAKLMTKIGGHYRRNRLVVDVPETMLGAQLFFRTQGFAATRVLRGDDGHGGEGAYRMERRMTRERGE